MSTRQDEEKSASRRYELQDTQYTFPYHYIPHFDATGRPVFVRSLSWGVEYLLYLSVVAEGVISAGVGTCLDVGCGDGRLAGMLADKGVRVTGIDLSERAISFARAFHPHIDFRTGNLDSIDGQYDTVTAVEVLEHIPPNELNAFVQALEARCRPGGRVIISVPSRCLPLHQKHYQHFAADEIIELFSHATPTLVLFSVEEVWAHHSALNVLLKLLANRCWTLDIPSVRGVIKLAADNQMRHVRAGKGRRIVAAFEKRQTAR